jgi:hypothetical protein
MMLNDHVTNNFDGERFYRGQFVDWRTMNNLSDRPSLFRIGATGVGPGSGTDKMSRPLGQVANPFADVNIDASLHGWSEEGGDSSGHSNLFRDDYPRIWQWYEAVFATTGGVLPMGRES